MASRFRSNQNIDLNSLVSFFDFSAGNFVNPSTVQIRNAIVTRNGSFDATDPNITPNLSEGDLVCSWSDNNGMPNTFEGGSIGVATAAATAISVQGDFYEVNATTWNVLDLQHFDNPANGRLRHLGNTPREYKVIVDFVAECTQNTELAVQVVKWDDSASAEVVVLTQIRQVNNLVGGLGS